MPASFKPRYFRAAMLSPFNLGALFVTFSTAAGMHDPLPALLAIGAELVYLGIVPALPGFKRRVEKRLAAKRSAEATQLADGMLAELSSSQREHFYALRDLKERILQNYQRLSGSSVLLLSSAQRIDELLASFLRLLSTLNSYRQYLGQSNRAEVERELNELVSDLEREPGPEKVREVRQKRAEILRKRLERFDQAAEHRELMSHQLASIEDMLRLLHEQSIGMRDPEVVSRQLETISAEVETTESTVRDLEAFLAFEQPAALPTRERVRG